MSAAWQENVYCGTHDGHSNVRQAIKLHVQGTLLCVYQSHTFAQTVGAVTCMLALLHGQHAAMHDK